MVILERFYSKIELEGCLWAGRWNVDGRSAHSIINNFYGIIFHGKKIIIFFSNINRKSMCEPREEYNRRMGSIENKFKVICQRYHELT